ncbi:MAG TPA: T9SS type A sorting domain-containing protein [Parafilimonas sp.]|nr:T9SS type A sorting domain-containing protein [Parafilimonas sp.]
MNFILRSFYCIVFIFIFNPSFSQPWQQVGDTLTGFNEAALAIDSYNSPYVVYKGSYPEGQHAFVKKLVGNSWVSLPPVDSVNKTESLQMVIGPDDLPVVSYVDSSTSSFHIKKFDGVKWNQLNNIDIGYKYRLAVDKKNDLYIAAYDREYGVWAHTNIFKYDGTQWNYVGIPNFTGVYSSDFDLAVNPVTNEPYFLYNLPSDGNFSVPQVCVQKFNGSNWEIVGQPNICTSINGAYYLNIDFDDSGNPFIAFQDDNGFEQISVYTLKNNIWQTVGKQYFSPEHCHNIILKVSYDGTPFVCFSKADRKSSVMKFNNDQWIFSGDTGFGNQPFKGSFSLGEGQVPYFLSAINYSSFVLLRNAIIPNDSLRISPGLFSQAGCKPWQQNSSGWVAFHEKSADSSFLGMQAYFRDSPGEICDYQSYIQQGNDLREAFGWNGSANKEYNSYSKRNFKIKFSSSSFSAPAGFRLFFTTEELADFVAQFNKQRGTFYTVNDIFIVQYDGTNQDYLLSNNSDNKNDYTKIYPSLHYYGNDNEKCYLEFFTKHCSEFYIGLSDTNTVLAISLINFTATLYDNKAVLEWTTASEVNSSRFNILRSTDGIHFSRVATVSAKGNGDVKQFHKYEDDVSSFSFANIYYRIEEVGTNEHITISEIRSVFKATQSVIKIFPNPAKTFVNISGQDITSVKLTDMSGKSLIVANCFNNQAKIVTSALIDGIYFVTVYVKGSIATTQKIIIKK